MTCDVSKRHSDIVDVVSSSATLRAKDVKGAKTYVIPKDVVAPRHVEARFGWVG